MNKKMSYYISIASGVLFCSCAIYLYNKRKNKYDFCDYEEDNQNSGILDDNDTLTQKLIDKNNSELKKAQELQNFDKIEKTPFVNNGYTYKHAYEYNKCYTKTNENIDNIENHENNENNNYLEEGEDNMIINNPDVLNEVPFSIAPEEFGEYTDYEPTTLYYYSDGVLADEDDNVIEDPVSMVGDDFMDHYGEYEDDCVYVRNDRYRRDYEVLKTEMSFLEHMSQKYSSIANSKYINDDYEE